MPDRRKIKWGVLSTANIGMKQVIPAMQTIQNAEIIAIGSRDLKKAKEAAQKLNIPVAYGSYAEIINDPEIEAIYNPLPNHLHYETTMACIQAGKHVLCEKPLVLTSEEVIRIKKAAESHQVKVGEAFMVHTHPQWQKTLEIIRAGILGELRCIHGFFSYFNVEEDNIRNIPEYGGGAMWDIGCYPVHTSRMIWGEEPEQVMAIMDYDPAFKTDRLTSAIMKFPSGTATFTVSTQLKPYQTMQFFGTEKHLEIFIPFNAPADQACKIMLNDGNIFQAYTEVLEMPICNQYAVQGEAFSDAILNDKPVPVDLDNTFGNIATIQAIMKSAESGNWESPARLDGY